MKPFLATVFVLGGVAMNAATVPATGIAIEFRVPFTEKFQGTGQFERKHRCARTAAPPAIDGRLDDRAWADSEPIVFGNGNAQTSVRICHDAAALYLAFECREPAGRVTQATDKDRDTDVWRDDAIEICIGPPQEQKLRAWYLFIISAANSVYDQKMRFSKPFGDPFNPEFSHATRIAEGCWTAEVALPATELGMPGWPTYLGVSLGRDGPGLGPSFWGRRRDVTSSALLFGSETGAQTTVPEAHLDAVLESNQPTTGDSLQVRVDRTWVRPGERWLDIACGMAPNVPLEQTRIAVTLFPIAGTTPLAALSVKPTRRRGRVSVDLRRHGLDAAEVALEFFENDVRTGASRFALSARACGAPLAPGDRIRLLIDAPADADANGVYPVTFGVPFPAGALWNAASVRLVDGRGRPVPHQKEVTALWARDGAIKWLRFDALVTPAQDCFVEAASAAGPVAPATPLQVSEHEDAIIVETGAARYVLGPGASPIREVWCGGVCRASAAGVRGLYVVDQNGRLAVATAVDESVRVEARGPVAACVRFEGWYATAAGERLARHITRIECFAGNPTAAVTHTLVLTQDTNEVWFRDIGWELAVAPGPAPRAVFGVDHEDAAKQVEVTLDPAVNSAYMLQDTHYYFNHGQNHFSVVATSAQTERIRLEGSECGDYAALLGDRGGLQFVCRNAALQHPKEFEVFPDKVILRLFGNRAGDELDFRTETLIRKWDLARWYETRNSNNMYVSYYRRSPLEVLEGYKSNAAGWAKTHLLLVAPLAAAETERAALNATRHRTPVLVHVDPQWLYRTQAMGPVYPRDPERFPEIEKTVDAYFRWLEEAQARWGEYGFVDYRGGPRFSYYERDGKLWPQMMRFNMTYALRANLWLLYARSANRDMREFIAGSARGHLDGKMSSWDTSVSRRGLIRSAAHRDLPFDWGEANMMQNGQTGCLNIHIWHYYLTGYRRAKDMVDAYAEAAKKNWTPAILLHPTYPAFTLLRLAQAYAFTWDPELLDLCAASMNILEDREAALRVNKYAYPAADPRYKAADIVRAYIEGWELLGETRYRDVALALSHHLLGQDLLKPVDSYVPTMGRVGAFLYDQAPRPEIAENMYAQILRVPTLYRAATGDILPGNLFCAAQTNFLARIGNALHVVTQANADREPAASYVAYTGLDAVAAVCVKKPEDATLTLLYSAPEPLVGNPAVAAIRPQSHYGVSNYRVIAATGYGQVILPKDMAGYTYRFVPGGSGSKAVFADRRIPMVLHAPGYWYPEPEQSPASKWYFRLPENSRDAQIFFEGEARLFDPAGAVFGSETPQHGWVDLPADRPGLWSFRPLDGKLVRARNFPPFFAARDPLAHFVPQIEWTREPRAAAPQSIPADREFVPGAIGTDGNQALLLAGTRGLTIEPGPVRTQGDGTRYLPEKEGTLEFFLQPLSWDSFSLPDPGRQRLFIGRQAGGGSFDAQYSTRGRVKELTGFLQSRYHNSERDQGETLIRSHRPNVLLERGRWVHLAYVWEQRDDLRYHPRKSTAFGTDVLTVRIYVNGKYAASPANRHSGQNSTMAGPLQSIVFSASGVAIDELRISDIPRYRSDFEPPSRDEEFRLDAHTRLLCHFNGDRTILTWNRTDTAPLNAE